MNPDTLPPCLRWSADPKDQIDQARAVPTSLFLQLHDALQASSSPSPSHVLAAWNKRLILAAAANNGVTDETLCAWIDAYAITWHLRQASGDFTATKAPNEPYVRLCAKLLASQAKRSSIPVATVNGHSDGRIQTLWIDVVDDQQDLILLHPQFESTRSNFETDFLTSIETAWLLAGKGVSSATSAFWHVTEADGSPVISEQQSGTSASAAAFRAFWHLRRGLRADEDVFVLASCASGDGTIKDVGYLGAKISAIQQHRDSLKQEAPATIVIAATDTNRTPQDDTAIACARTWAEVVQVGTLEELIAVRSVTVQSARDYLSYLADHWDKTPWYRNGKSVRFSEVHIPPHVWRPKPGHSLLADAASPDGRTEERDWRPTGYDPSVADREAGPRLERTRIQERVPWHETFRNNEAITVIAGGPGSGKTSILQWTARMMALRGLDDLEKRTTDPDDIDWPIQTDLDAWASLTGQPVETLERATIDGLALVETWGANRLKALRQFMKRRLIQSKAKTSFFFDALDQVSESRVTLLGDRLQAIASFSRPEWPNDEPVSASKPCSEKLAREIMSRGTKILISTRESGLRTHYQAMSFTSISTLQAAALSAEEAKELAAKWLGADQAARLEAHLRANPSLSVVADSPLLLTLACLVQAEQPQRDLPETPAALYQEIMRLLAKGAWRSAGVKSGALPNADELLDSLAPIVWRLFSRDAGTNRFDRSALLDAIVCATGRPQVEATKLLAHLVDLGFLESSGHQKGEEHFHFRHATFREFLAASHLASRINRDGWQAAEVDTWQTSFGWKTTKAGHLLDTHVFEPTWEPLFEFTAGLLRQPKPLLEMLSDKSKDDLYRYRLILLCKCYGSLAPDKEDGVHDLMERVLPRIERMGRIARRRHPDRWAGWLKATSHLLNLPKVGSRVIRFFTQPDDHESWMMVRHESLELLSRAAQNMQCGAGMEALLVICEGEVDHRELGDAATKVVELAERLGLPDSIKRLEQAMDAAGEKPYNQIKLARALLRTSDARIANKAFGLLNALAESKSIEDWCRRMAVHALVETLDTPLEAQGAAAIIPHLFDSSDADLNQEYRKQLAGDITSAARPYRSKVTFALQCLILRLELDHHVHCRWVGGALIRWDDATAQMLGTELLLNQVQNERIEYYERTEAAEALLEHGCDSARATAISVLKSMATSPIEDGRCRILPIRALLKAGHAYNDEISQYLYEFGTADGLRPGWIVDAAEIASEYHDAALLESLMPRLRSILNRQFNLQPHETGYSERRDAAKLFFGTTEWEPLEKNAFARLRGNSKAEEEDWFSVNVVCFGAKSSALIALTEELLAVGKRNFHPWVLLMRELALRGWRFQVSRRKIVILRRGQEEPRADAEFGY